MLIAKRDLIYLSIIAGLLFFIGCSSYNDGATLKKNDESIAKLEGQVIELKRNTREDSLKAIVIRNERDSLIEASFVVRTSRETIKHIYHEKKINILSLSTDSSFKFSARWLSEADTLR